MKRAYSIKKWISFGLRQLLAAGLMIGISLLVITPVQAQYQMSQPTSISIPQLMFVDQIAGESATFNKPISTPISFDRSKIAFVVKLNGLTTPYFGSQQSITSQVLGTASAELKTATPSAAIISDQQPIIIAEVNTVTTLTATPLAKKPTPTTTVSVSSEPADIAPKKAVAAPVAPSEFDAFFDKYGTEYGIDPTILRSIARCESGMNPGAVSKNGLYHGLFQFVASTWSSNRKAMGLDPSPSLMTNPEEAIKTASFKMSRDGIGAWPHCGKKATQVASI